MNAKALEGLCLENNPITATPLDGKSGHILPNMQIPFASYSSVLLKLTKMNMMLWGNGKLGAMPIMLEKFRSHEPSHMLIDYQWLGKN